MPKTARDRHPEITPKSDFWPARRRLIQILCLAPVAPFPVVGSGITHHQNTDEILLHIEREILKAVSDINEIIARQGLAERAVFEPPADPQQHLALDAIDQELAAAHEHLAQLIVTFNSVPASTPLGLQVKARLSPYGDEISRSLCEDVLGLSGSCPRKLKTEASLKNAP